MLRLFLSFGLTTEIIGTKIRDYLTLDSASVLTD